MRFEKLCPAFYLDDFKWKSDIFLYFFFPFMLLFWNGTESTKNAPPGGIFLYIIVRFSYWFMQSCNIHSIEIQWGGVKEAPEVTSWSIILWDSCVIDHIMGLMCVLVFELIPNPAHRKLLVPAKPSAGNLPSFLHARPQRRKLGGRAHKVRRRRFEIFGNVYVT